VGRLDPEALCQCAPVATKPLDEATVHRALAKFSDLKVERRMDKSCCRGMASGS
jgi:hypothetical protein